VVPYRGLCATSPKRWSVPFGVLCPWPYLVDRLARAFDL
jgi:hypothetical protein